MSNRWSVRVASFDLSRNGFNYPTRLADSFVAGLPFAPVRACRRGRHLMHPDDGDPLRGLVGCLLEPWANRHAVFAVLQLVDEAAAVRGLLEQMERDGELGRIGLSIVARIRYRERQTCGRVVKDVVSITAVEAVDLVTIPSAGGRVLRSLPVHTETHSLTGGPRA